MDYAVALNAEIRDLFAAGADVVQIDEPYMQARPEEARDFGLTALNRALEGVTGTTAVHICFGYAAIIHARPSGYSFLPELADCSCQQVSVETAQSKLDCSVLTGLPGKKIMLGVIDLADPTVESPETVAARIRRALPYVDAARPDHRAGLRHEVPAARSRLRQAAGDGRRRADRARGTGSHALSEFNQRSSRVNRTDWGDCTCALQRRALARCWPRRWHHAVALPARSGPRPAVCEEVVVTARKRDETFLDVPVTSTCSPSRRSSRPASRSPATSSRWCRT